MMVPADIIVVDKIPLLGSGKIDNMALSLLARERVKLEGVA
jgi:acyl-CoA synthetase (AMP-forming)/AMP-acid ligase II